MTHFATSNCWTVLVALVLAGAPAMAAERSAEDAAHQGDQLLAAGDFTGAMKAYATAARTDRSNGRYLQQYVMTRRVVELRTRLDAEKDGRKWEATARALHAFYVNNDIHQEALKLGTVLHERLGSASSARWLAESQLALGKNAEAAETLSALDPTIATPSTQALYGVALAREGKTEQAREIAELIELPDAAGAGMLLCAARLQAATGQTDRAAQLLTRSFQSTPPSRLPLVKQRVRSMADFSELDENDALARAMKTVSKVSESSCSGGSKCATCPSRGGCSKEH